MKTIILFALVAVALARPQGPSTTPVPIVLSESDVSGDGSYRFRFESGDGVKRQEQGVQKQITAEDAGHTAQGSYSYTAPDGTIITLTYSADENGFQPKGNHLPTPPPVPELPVAIARSLEIIARTNAAKQHSN